MIRLLLIGPLPPPMGGDTRHFATLVEDLGAQRGFSVKLFNTSRGPEHSRLLPNLAAAARTLLTLLVNLPRVDVVSFHASDRGMFLLGPAIVLLSKLARTPTVLRLFGGSFGDFYRKRGALGRALIRSSILSANVVLLQTQRAIEQLRPHAVGRLEWFSTYVKLPARDAAEQRRIAQDARTGCSRFVFLGHLWRTKGLETMLEAAPHLPDGCRIDIYGPLDEYTAETIEERGMGRVRYRGFLTHAQVDSTLWDYDCLVLPTFHPGEGYPGVIAEAFVHGLPVITTKWLAIPEIVDEQCGILIEPSDTRAFVAAMAALNADSGYWRRLREGARERAARFDHCAWSAKFEAICQQLTQA
jgi:glycosyltransferase involved in cell wall biosynthesis